jgi:hypothetical protein
MEEPIQVKVGESAPELIEAKVPVPLLLSPEFRWVYSLFQGFLILTAVALIGIGTSILLFGIPAKDMAFGIFCCVAGFFSLLICVGINQARRYFSRMHEAAVATVTKVALANITESDFEQIDQITRIREHKAQVDFERNVGDAFLVHSLEMRDVGFFGPCSWQLKPGVNILLGRNGYGKSLILRTLAALLQRNEEASKDLFASASGQAFLELNIERNGNPERIRRESQRFTESVGKIPILAIPDSRFVTRHDTSIEAPKDDALDLRVDGARHFLEDLPYGDMMRMLFNELCFDYLETNSFERPVFGFLGDAIRELTGDRLQFHSVERVGRNAFRLLVLTEGNERPLPIQYASQGTLSVLGVVGIVRSYLKALSPNTRGEEFLKKPAIVLIDELDAHLHPLWQQRLTGILRTNFPNVQFVLAAHSPLVVAGCWVGEVNVLRRGPSGLTIEPVPGDFIGTSIEKIYKDVFKLEAIDPSYLKLATQATSGFSEQHRISELEQKANKATLTELERRELPRLLREENMIGRAAEVKVEREDDRDRIIELEAKIESLEDQLKRNQVS